MLDIAKIEKEGIYKHKLALARKRVTSALVLLVDAETLPVQIDRHKIKTITEPLTEALELINSL